MGKAAPRATKDRLLAAAARLFAERGFHATSVREIAERAGTNIASGNYHYGSKKALYLEVLREQFQNIRAELKKSGGAPAPAEISRLSKRDLTKALRLRLLTTLKLTLGPPPGLHGALMQREMADPSEALPVIVDEFIVPMTEEMGEIIAHLFPTLRPRDVERCVYSMVGQAMFYRFTMPALLHMQKRDEYPPEMARDIAEHIAEFSLAGAKWLAEANKRVRRAR
jgi:AcrR family transcriptional regulator